MPLRMGYLAGLKRPVEKLWYEFFSDPSQWWDHRSEKGNPRFPDFKHKKTKKSLWLNGRLNPPWVEAELAAIAPGTLQLNIFSWSVRLARHVKDRQYEKTIELFRQMQQEGMNPDTYSFVQVLNACTSLRDLEEGKRIHAQIIQTGCESDVFVSSCLVDMYAKCRSIEDARKVFKKMPVRNKVAWTAMILGHVKCGQGQKALELFQSMQQDQVEPDSLTFVGVLNACASIAALEEGKHVHEKIIRSGSESDVFVGNGLVDMYAKCGSIKDAERVFNKMVNRNVVSWTSMLGGYAMHGHANEALGHFEHMCEEGVEKNEVTFVSLLSACNHGGLVEEGLHHFASMSSVYGIPRTVDHYACIIDLLARTGRLHEAEDLIKMMSCEPDSTVWMSLLGACKVHRNMVMGERIAKLVQHLEPENPTGLVLLSNIYAAAGKWDSRAILQKQR